MKYLFLTITMVLSILSVNINAADAPTPKKSEAGDKTSAANPEASKEAMPAAADKSTAKPAADKSDAKPAADKSDAKPAADKSDAKPATDKADAKPTTDKSDAKPAADKSDAKPAADKSDAKPAADKSDAKPATDKSDAKPAADKSDAKPATDKSGAKPEDKSATSSTDKPLKKKVATLNLTGKWQARWGKGSKMEIVLEQQDDKVTGNYEEGQIEGTLSGNTLSGKWSESDGEGDFELVFSADGKKFTGKWRDGFSGDWDKDPWDGELVSQ